MNKYRNVKTVVDGISFDSKKEAAYYGTLKMRKLAGEIDMFERQVQYSIFVDNCLICNYYADFRTWKDNSVLEVIDVKGIKTQVYQIKKKLMKAVYGIDILEK